MIPMPQALPEIENWHITHLIYISHLLAACTCCITYADHEKFAQIRIQVRIDYYPMPLKAA